MWIALLRRGSLSRGELMVRERLMKLICFTLFNCLYMYLHECVEMVEIIGMEFCHGVIWGRLF